jgi:hypothetical protein
MTEIAVTGRTPRLHTRLLGQARLLDPVSAVCLGYIVAIAIVALLAPWIAPHDPYTLDILARFQGPSAAHLLGDRGELLDVDEERDVELPAPQDDFAFRNLDHVPAD